MDAFGDLTPTDAIHGNPMNNLQCANAILEHDNIDIDALLKEHLHQIRCTKHQDTVPSVWTREAVGALLNHECYRPHTPLRTTNEFWAMINNQTSESAKEQGTDVPVYFHMPKCASSTTATMLKKARGFAFNFTWNSRGNELKMMKLQSD